MSAVAAGFDPGMSPGIAAVTRTANGYQLLHAGTLRTTASQPFEQRCAYIFRHLSLLLRTHSPSILAIEDQRGVQAGLRMRGADGREVHAGSSKTLIMVGLAIGCAEAYGVPWCLVQPKRVKIAVLGKGHGSAEKKQVQAAIEAITGKRVAQDAADASAIAIAGAQFWAGGRRAA